jgi:hypothetical protein
MKEQGKLFPVFTIQANKVKQKLRHIPRFLVKE